RSGLAHGNTVACVPQTVRRPLAEDLEFRQVDLLHFPPDDELRELRRVDIALLDLALGAVARRVFCGQASPYPIQFFLRLLLLLEGLLDGSHRSPPEAAVVPAVRRCTSSGDRMTARSGPPSSSGRAARSSGPARMPRRIGRRR